ncbi:hypothetical protein WA158_002976 [Blastocystis sp. Blastoise]
MNSISHCSFIEGPFYTEHIEPSLNLVGKNISHITTVVNGIALENVKDFILTDIQNKTYQFPGGNYDLMDFINKLCTIIPEFEYSSSLNCLSLIGHTFLRSTATNEYFFKILNLPHDATGSSTNMNNFVFLTDNYVLSSTIRKIYLLRIYSSIINKDNDLISIPIYTQDGYDNHWSLSNISIPLIDGFYNDIQWEVRDQNDNPVNISHNNIQIFFTCS